MQILLELEKLIDIEIQTFDGIEKKLLEKKETIIKGHADRLKTVDLQLLEYHKKLEQIVVHKKLINKEFGDENKTLSEIIKGIQDKNIAQRFENKKTIINTKTKKIQRLNEVIQELIQHALKLIEGSVLVIAEAFNPEGRINYDSQGRKQSGSSPMKTSSIIEEA
jgi:hypothetical protein